VAFSCNAPILLLDEPVLGLDANFRDLFYREMITLYNEKPRTIVISTHLIEEAADVIEHVFIIKGGKVIMNDTAQNVLGAGYTVTGPVSLIDAFTDGRRVLGCDTLGGIKSAYLLEPLDAAVVPVGVEVSRMRLQNLFIHLTNTQGGLEQ
jgi:ABC-2 type transport system ATP-binding protein